MSSLAPAPEAAGLRARRAGPPTRRLPVRVTGDSLLGLAIAAAFSLLAFATTGGVDLGSNTWAEIVLVLLGAGAGVAVTLIGARGPRWGLGALLLFLALAALTYASIAWSVQPASSWLEANRTLSYLAAFAVALALARLTPRRWPALITGVALYALAVSVYALLTKVFPGSLDASDVLGRLRAPFDYYNATGLVAALGIPAWLFMGAAAPAGRGLGPGSRWLGRALPARVGPVLSVPALGLLVCTLILSYGRGALAAVIVGLAIWFVLVPVRLRAALILGLGAGGGTVLGVWATGRRGLTHDYVDMASRTAAGHHFGLVLVVSVALLLAAGVAAAGLARQRLSPPARRRVGTVLVGLLALVPVVVVVALATSSRGFGGEVSHLWSSLTNPSSTVSDSPARLAQLGSSRPKYWGEGLKVGGHAPLAGVGAGGFAVAERRYAVPVDRVSHAHSYVFQTFADLGALGLLLSGGLLLAWSLAVRRTLRTPPGPGAAGAEEGTNGAAAGPGAAGAEARSNDGQGAEIERAALITLLVAVIVFGAHSMVDWTWFIPGAAVPALACAGWLAGRGPLDAPVGRLPRPRSPGAAPLRAGAALGLVALGLAAAWAVWQPLRSADADSAAFAALQRGDAGTALTDARTAARADPVDVAPLYTLAGIYTATGNARRARGELVQALGTQPQNPDTWETLAAFDRRHGWISDAQEELSAAYPLDPYAVIKQR